VSAFDEPSDEAGYVHFTSSHLARRAYLEDFHTGLSTRTLDKAAPG
jgi:hypothetical protein